MNGRISLACLALLLGTSLGFGDEAKPSAPPPKAPDVKTPDAKAPDAMTPDAMTPDGKAQTGALGADMAAVLRKAGFTDLQIMPNSILVRGKDKSGNPVAMVLNPGSMTEVVTLDPHSGSAAAGNGGGAPLTGSSVFPTILPTARLASTLIGLKVRDFDGQEIGTVKDLAVDHDGVQAYIIATGGVLGIGDRYVAVAPLAITLIYDQVANSYRATMKGTADQLRAAPAFTYEGSFKAGRD